DGEEAPVEILPKGGIAYGAQNDDPLHAPVVQGLRGSAVSRQLVGRNRSEVTAKCLRPVCERRGVEAGANVPAQEIDDRYGNPDGARSVTKAPRRQRCE